MPQRADDHASTAFERAEDRLFAACGVQVAGRRVHLADPPVAVRVLEATGRRSFWCTAVA